MCGAYGAGARCGGGHAMGYNRPSLNPRRPHPTPSPLDVSRYIGYYRVMLVYDVLATLWETTSTDLEIAHAVEVRSGAQISRNIVNQHIRLLLNTGHITAKNSN